MKSRPDIDELLRQITELSHRFGSVDYVHGGGGNTSVKTEDALWVKPSGLALKALQPDSFVALDRSRLSALYGTELPENIREREKLIKNVLAEARLLSSPARPSVEALLHDSLSARFVVHTHPALVNGMTCAKEGSEAAAELFGQALWVDYFDPGITLCMEVRRRIKNYKNRTTREPEIVFLKNHGVFVAADSSRRIEELYKLVIEKLTDAYGRAGIALRLPVSALPPQAEIQKVRTEIERAWGKLCLVEVNGKFDCAEGPLSPDHIVYAKSFPFTETPTAEAVSAFEKRYGYKPRVFVGPATVCGAAPSQRQAAIALELARDGALVKHLATAFGGVEYVSEAARRFIEGWEAETYRSSRI